MRFIIDNKKTIASLLVLCLIPLLANEFWLVQIGAQTFIFGLITLGFIFLAGYGGMVSLATMAIAGMAGYMVAIFGFNSEGVGMEWHWLFVVLIALLMAVLFGIIIGIISTRTQGIYTIMITLAIATGFFYFTRQNYAVFNGFTGYAGIQAPTIGGLDLRQPIYFYYLTLSISVLFYLWIKNCLRSTFGIALQGIKDNARRMRALGFNVTKHRIAAHAFAALLSAIGGILLVWMNGRIDPATINVEAAIAILMMGVVGGMKHPLGAFLGAFIFILLGNFAIDIIGSERFNTLIGAVFVIIVLFSPDGVVGLLKRLFNTKLPKP